MRCDGCSFNACSCLGIIISVVFGAIVGVLFAFGFIPFIETAAWIALGLGVFSLIVLIAASFLAGITAPNPLSSCLCGNAACLLAGIIGTIIASIIALSIVLDPAFISVIALVAIGALFFALMIVGLISLICCIASRACAQG